MKPIDTALVGKAVAAYCADHKMQFAEGSLGGHARWLIFPEGCKPDDGIVVRLVEGKLACEEPAVKTDLSELIIDMRSEAEPAESPRAPVPRTSQPATRPAPRNGSGGRQGESVVDEWRKKQDRTYSVEGGKTVPNAFAASEEANRRRFNVEVDGGRSDTVAWGKARAVDPETGRFREAKVTFEWTAFRQKTAWEIVRGMEKREPGILQGVDDVTMLPILAPVPYKGQPASLYLHLQILNRWTFADRDAESKAERRAVLKLANREWREDDEVDSERAEEEAVRGLKA